VRLAKRPTMEAAPSPDPDCLDRASKMSVAAAVVAGPQNSCRRSHTYRRVGDQIPSDRIPVDPTMLPDGSTSTKFRATEFLST